MCKLLILTAMWIYHFPGNCLDHSQNCILLARKTLSSVTSFCLPTLNSLSFRHLAPYLLWAITSFSVNSYLRRCSISIPLCTVNIKYINVCLWCNVFESLEIFDVPQLCIAVWRVQWCGSLGCSRCACSQPEPSQWGGAVEEGRGGGLSLLYLHLPEGHSPGTCVLYDKEGYL